MARNPKDVMVSYYFHHKLFKAYGFRGDLETFVQYFMDDEGFPFIEINLNYLNLSILNLYLVMYSPYFPHIIDAWNKRHHPNLKFVFYEDMKKVILHFKIIPITKIIIKFILCFQQNLRGEIEKIAQFLGKSLTEEQLDRITEHLRIDSFAKNESANYEVGKTNGLMNLDAGNFVRKGIDIFNSFK